jgi:hypothetical protein
VTFSECAQCNVGSVHLTRGSYRCASMAVMFFKRVYSRWGNLGEVNVEESNAVLRMSAGHSGVVTPAPSHRNDRTALYVKFFSGLVARQIIVHFSPRERFKSYKTSV